MPASEKSDCWLLLCLLIFGLYIRLLLVPFPGFFPDTEQMIGFVRGAERSGFTADIWDSVVGVAYPPVFIYQAVVASRIVNELSGRNASQAENGITPWSRIGVRIVPILCDVLVSGLLFFAISRKCSRASAVLAASLYLFNPGVVVNSALWNCDAIPAFLMLLAVFLAYLAFERQNHGWLTLASVVCALGFCTKLQAGMILPALGAFILLTKDVRTMVKAALAFSVTTVLAYAPFILERQWDYLKKVFIGSFTSYPVTHANAYGAWALWYQLPVSRTVMGVSLANIGRIAYLAATAFAVHALLTKRANHVTREDAARRFAIVGAYICVAPFVVLTQMHERYLATAIPLAVLAGFLDRRLMAVGIGFSLTYALNMLAIGVHFWDPWGDISETSPYFEPVRLLFIVNRVFCSLLNVALFIWLTARLRVLLATRPREGFPPKSECPSASLSGASS